MKTPPVSEFESRLAELRRHLQEPTLAALDNKVVHLILAALGASAGDSDAALHGLAAIRAGASWAEIEALGALVERQGGLPACGTGSTFVRAVQSLEHQSRVDGHVAANG